MDYLSTSSSSAAGAEGVAITISKSAVAKKLGSTRQSLYYQPKLPARDLLLKSQVEVVMKNHPAYGYRRIAIALGVNRKRVSRVMRQFNLKPRRSPNYRPQPRRSLQQAAAAHSNLLTGLAITRPNQAWVSDFTYLPYQGRFVYLATILDSYTRELIGWNVSVHSRGGLCNKLPLLIPIC
jgi:transposase InsO family protein